MIQDDTYKWILIHTQFTEINNIFSDTHHRLFPQKGQDVVIMTKKGFAFKVINASLITEMMQL